MSKIETLQNYSVSQTAPQMQIIQATRDLQELTSTLTKSLENMPLTLACETEKALDPLRPMLAAMQQDLTILPEALAQEISQILAPLQGLDKTSVENILGQQRRTVEILGRELQEQAAVSTIPIRKIAEGTSIQIAKMQQTVTQFSRQTTNLVEMTKKLDGLPQRLLKATRQLEITLSKDRMTWQELTKLAMIALIAGLISAGTLLAGTRVFDWPAPPTSMAEHQVQQRIIPQQNSQSKQHVR